MLRIYLDQNKWVDLARAATGHRLGKPFKDALDLCRAGVDAGTLSFPLDMYRYWEPVSAETTARATTSSTS